MNRDDKIRQLREQGMGCVLISREVGLSEQVVSRKLKKMGFPPLTNQSKVSNISHGIDFVPNLDNFQIAAEDYLIFICEYCGFPCCKPNSAQPYDFLVDFGNGWKKVQVKTTSSKKQEFSIIKTRHTQKKRYSKSDFDFLFLLRNDLRAWLIPFSEVEQKSTVKPDHAFPNCEIKMMSGWFGRNDE